MASPESFKFSKESEEAGFQDQRMESDLAAVKQGAFANEVEAKERTFSNDGNPIEKKVTGLDILHAQAQIEDLRRRESVKVLRSSGELEDDWRIRTVVDPSLKLVRVEKKDADGFLVKDVRLTDLVSWNS